MGYDRDVFSVNGDGYRLDLVSQLDVITVRRSDGSVFGYFGKMASREKIVQAIVEDGGAGARVRGSIFQDNKQE